MIPWDEGMIDKVSKYIEENNLISESDKIVVGVSGGADSVCLLHVLNELYRERSVELLVAHIHHGIRGEAADRDEAFVRQLADKLELPFLSYRYDIPRIAEEEGMTEEEAGRELRYRTFLTICNTYGCNKIAVAHNRNDNAETVLFNLFRGSGIRGLGGISSSREASPDQKSVTMIRPLLFVLREEIEEYLRNNRIEYCTDASNLSECYSRNKLRNNVLSYVTREVNFNAVTHITEAAEDLKEASDFIEKQVMTKFEELVKFPDEGGEPLFEFDADAMNREDIVLQKGILIKIIEKLSGSRRDISRTHVLKLLELLRKPVGKQISLPYGITAKRSYHAIRIFRQEELIRTRALQERIDPVILKIPGSIMADSVGKVVESGIISNKKGLTFPKNSCTKWFDYDKIENALELRTRKDGDYLQINSLGGRKKLKDYFIDQKLPKEQRDSVLLLADGSHILWILADGDRMSEKYKITEETDRILWININNAEEKEDGR